MVFADKMNDIIEVLENDGVILFPSDTIWMLGSSMRSKSAVKTIHKLKFNLSEYPFTVMFSDMAMMKKHLPDIHPRVETLMSYHKKPLSIIDSNWKNVPEFVADGKETLNFHLVRDDFVQTIIDLLGNPMVVSAVRDNNLQFVDSFDQIPDRFKESVDYICNHKRLDENIGQPSVIASYDKKGNLNFYRE